MLPYASLILRERRAELVGSLTTPPLPCRAEAGILPPMVDFMLLIKRWWPDDMSSMRYTPAMGDESCLGRLLTIKYSSFPAWRLENLTIVLNFHSL
jgi:hypothetical protein